MLTGRPTFPWVMSDIPGACRLRHARGSGMHRFFFFSACPQGSTCPEACCLPASWRAYVPSERRCLPPLPRSKTTSQEALLLFSLEEKKENFSERRIFERRNFLRPGPPPSAAAPEWRKLTILDKMIKIDQKWSKWSKIDQNGHRRTYVCGPYPGEYSGAFGAVAPRPVNFTPKSTKNGRF